MGGQLRGRCGPDGREFPISGAARGADRLSGEVELDVAKSPRQPARGFCDAVAAMPRPALLLAAALVLAAATLAAYQGVLANGFVNYDDDLYITKVAEVQAGAVRQALSAVLE